MDDKVKVVYLPTSPSANMLTILNEIETGNKSPVLSDSESESDLSKAAARRALSDQEASDSDSDSSEDEGLKILPMRKASSMANLAMRVDSMPLGGKSEPHSELQSSRSQELRRPLSTTSMHSLPRVKIERCVCHALNARVWLLLLGVSVFLPLFLSRAASSPVRVGVSFTLSLAPVLLSLPLAG